MPIAFHADYQHGQIHVHYDLSAESGQWASLNSNDGKAWRLIFSPTETPDGAVRFDVKIEENGRTVQEPTLILTKGESATVTMSSEGDTSSLTISATPLGK